MNTECRAKPKSAQNTFSQLYQSVTLARLTREVFSVLPQDFHAWDTVHGKGKRGPSQERSYICTAGPRGARGATGQAWGGVRAVERDSQPKSPDLGLDAEECCGLILVHMPRGFHPGRVDGKTKLDKFHHGRS